MKNITSLREEMTMYIVYFADHYLEDDEFEDAQCMHFQDRERAIGAAMALLSIVKNIYYACVCKVVMPLDEDETEGVFIWEATADDGESNSDDIYDPSSLS